LNFVANTQDFAVPAYVDFSRFLEERESMAVLLSKSLPPTPASSMKAVNGTYLTVGRFLAVSVTSKNQYQRGQLSRLL
jgi:hypothetical protein